MFRNGAPHLGHHPAGWATGGIVPRKWRKEAAMSAQDPAADTRPISDNNTERLSTAAQ
jgi:hypothetical protein